MQVLILFWYFIFIMTIFCHIWPLKNLNLYRFWKKHVPLKCFKRSEDWMLPAITSWLGFERMKVSTWEVWGGGVGVVRGNQQYAFDQPPTRSPTRPIGWERLWPAPCHVAVAYPNIKKTKGLQNHVFGREHFLQTMRKILGKLHELLGVHF